MKTLFSILAFVFAINLCSGQHYISQGDMDRLAALVQNFDVNYHKLINQKDASAAKEIKKSIFILSSKMDYFSTRISASTSIDEKEGMSPKALALLSISDMVERPIKVEFTKSQADKLAQYAHNLLNIKSHLRDQRNKINLDDEKDVQLITDFNENLQAFHEIQTKTFDKAYSRVTR